jgi:hypothetical protein
MSNYDYFLLGGSQHGRKHTEKAYKNSLEFTTKEAPPYIFTTEQQEFYIEKYTVYTESGPDGKLYLIGCCNVKKFPSQAELFGLLSKNKIEPLPNPC